MELTPPEQMQSVGLFLAPERVARVKVAVEFGDFSGYEAAPGGGVIDSRVAPLRSEAPLAYLAEHDREVVHPDQCLSLQMQGEAKLLLPSLDVRYWALREEVAATRWAFLRWTDSSSSSLPWELASACASSSPRVRCRRFRSFHHAC